MNDDLQESSLDKFTESYWLRDAKKSLATRDPLDALRDAEELLGWARRRWGDTLSIENLNDFLRRNK